MLIKRIAVATAMSLFGLVASSQTANAQSLRHVDNLAAKLTSQLKDVNYEFGKHYRHTGEFRHLVSDARKMAGLANHIHEVAHHGGNPFHLRDDVKKLNRAFHHLEHLIDDIEYDVRRGRAGHFHGDTRHVRRLLKGISNTLHHLQDDVKELTRWRHGHERVIKSPRRGISFGNGRFRIRFGR